MGRLFAVIQVSGKQRKITTDDIIVLDKHLTADVGEIIRLNKVIHSVLRFFFAVSPIWGRCVEFSFSSFAGLASFLSILMCSSCLCVTSLHPSFGLPIFQCHFLVPFTTSSSVFLSSCTNHLILTYLIIQLMFVAFSCDYFSCPDILNLLYSHHPSQHSHLFYLVNVV